MGRTLKDDRDDELRFRMMAEATRPRVKGLRRRRQEEAAQQAQGER